EVSRLSGGRALGALRRGAGELGGRALRFRVAPGLLDRRVRFAGADRVALLRVEVAEGEAGPVLGDDPAGARREDEERLGLVEPARGREELAGERVAGVEHGILVEAVALADDHAELGGGAE